jgi:RND family efflux transporter MFP subunit
MADMPAYFEAGGTLRARTTAVISSRVLAPVTDVRVRPGDAIRAGQLLIQLDARESDANALRASSARDAAAEAVRAAEADERAAGTARELARVTHERISTLQARKSATAQELDDAVAVLAAAEARAAGARAHLNEARSSQGAARAAADAAGIAASYARLTAPFDGLVVARSVDPGSVAVPGLPLLTIEGRGDPQLEVRLDEARIARVAVGQTVDVRIGDTDAAAAAWLAGRVAEIARLDPAAHSFTAKIDVPANPAWRSGLFGRARFADSSRRVLTVPAPALVRRGQLTLVFVASEDGHAQLRPVSVGEIDASRAEILAGLGDGETVVLDPPATIRDGTRIRTAPGARR